MKFYLCLLLFSNIYSQEGHNENALAIIKKCQKQYVGSTSFKASTTYNLYKGATSKTISGGYDGSIVKNNDDLYMRIDSTEFISSKGMMLKVSHKQKAMLFLKVASTDIQNPLEIASFLKHFKTISLSEEGEFWVCKLTSHVLTQMPYQSIKLFIDKVTFELRKQELLYVKKASFAKGNKKEDYDFPRLEVLISKLDTQHINKELFNIHKYLDTSQKELKPSLRYNHYSLYTE